MTTVSLQQQTVRQKTLLGNGGNKKTDTIQPVTPV